MEVGGQSVIKVILLQIPPPVREAVWVCLAYCHDRLMYTKHVLLHHLVIPLLDLIQGPDHGIIIWLVAKCSLHVYQQVPHRDVLTFIQHASPFTGYPWRLAKMCRHILASSYCSRKASTSKHQSMYITSAPGSVDMKISISSPTGTSRFLSLLPLWPLHLCRHPAVLLAVEYPLESSVPLTGEEGGKPSANCSALSP